MSLLWRAAATSRKEFEEIKINIQDLEKLRKMILEKNPNPIYYFGITLIQISSIGIDHNFTPISEEKEMPISPYFKNNRIEPIFRFYIDGLIIHFSRLPPEEYAKFASGEITVGFSQELVITSITFEASRQASNLRNIMEEAGYLPPTPP